MPNASLTLRADKSTAHWLLKVINTNANMLHKCLFTIFSPALEADLAWSGPVRIRVWDPAFSIPEKENKKLAHSLTF
jgi:hypothetical protein